MKITPATFTVLTVELSGEALNKYIDSLDKIELGDFKTNMEGTWECIRTTNPFAYGMMKEVFLMKKKNENREELYVIKTPIGGKTYARLEDAI